MTMLQKAAPIKPETAAASPLKDSFFRSCARVVRTYQLGDLLVSGGMITAEQLKAALAEQAKGGGQLGAVLIRQQALTAVQLYRKLGEQWCMRVAAAGVAVLVQTASPSSAQASETEATSFTQDASFQKYPELFGTHETRSEDTSAFKKWMVMINRFEAPLASDAPASASIASWKKEIESLQGLPRREQIRRVNDFLNQITYVDDRRVYGEKGYWAATPERFFGSGGDCKNYAIAKYVSLRMLGFTDKELRVAVVQDMDKGIAHAVLIVYSDDEAFVLDNQSKKVERVQTVNRYQPYFSINQSAWWLHHA
jgi:predicted transglutaminase-like cysteine proteinase